MHSFKKAIIASILFLFFIFSLFFLMIFIVDNSNCEYYYDAKYRNENSGNFDFIISGSSQSTCGVISSVVQEKLNVNAYNLSGYYMPIYARNLLLEKEIERNPVKFVVIEISHNALTRDYETETFENAIYSLSRFETISDRFNYIKKYVKSEEYGQLLKYSLKNYIASFKACIKSENRHKNDLLKGVCIKQTVDVSLNATEVIEKFKSEESDGSFSKENIDSITDMINKLKSKDIDVVLISLPYSESFIWSQKDLDKQHMEIQHLADKSKVLYYDFNLAKNRFDLYNDKASFYNPDHLSYSGAKVFTNELCKVLKLSDQEIDDMFYDSYEDVIENMDYMHIYNANK